ncbi:UBAP1-MVB12-associated (UMA)-domain containing protein 1 [Callorhinchus milii]|uniref:UMA domain-containing protein n=1 Tax=Callorhinchus milii TaxID=7868 RepID=A0A4W3I8V9_CALMI|nr:UBAP1-MVB12-associated (UMA)-domain containing protein 1 [Callorhinchus milii]
MLTFLGIRKNTESPKKSSTSEKEADGFILLGETVSEREQEKTSLEFGRGTSTHGQLPQGEATNIYPALTEETATAEQMNQPEENTSLAVELLGDVPFTLAPHILALQASFHDFPDALKLPKDVNENLANFWYDFTLENSVLYDS